ncbi:hypothetical protein B0H16DRAFT_1739174 [Mycena metata]|uniref:Uncharacterized protein n=1 Tax=Mycena metata TaxID=1033252 RepID=A0AAD7MJZ6_9AGAR|nr:hypothetical protein B0H16DRAFT_1739174 [Mycena metata]
MPGINSLAPTVSLKRCKGPRCRPGSASANPPKKHHHTTCKKGDTALHAPHVYQTRHSLHCRATAPTSGHCHRDETRILRPLPAATPSRSRPVPRTRVQSLRRVSPVSFSRRRPPLLSSYWTLPRDRSHLRSLPSRRNANTTPIAAAATAQQIDEALATPLPPSREQACRRFLSPSPPSSYRIVRYAKSSVEVAMMSTLLPLT